MYPSRERQDLLLGLAKTVANNTAALVLKAKNVASKCEDQYTQNRVRETEEKYFFCRMVPLEEGGGAKAPVTEEKYLFFTLKKILEFLGICEIL